MTKQWSCALIIALSFATQSVGMRDRCPQIIRNASLHACPPTRSSLLLLGLIAIGTTIGYYSTPDSLPEINHHGFITNQTHPIIPELSSMFHGQEHNQTKPSLLEKRFKKQALKQQK